MKKRQILNLECLETRKLMAGDITAVMNAGVIRLTEAPGHYGEANHVQISQLANGNIHISGAIPNYSTSKINGQGAIDIAVPAGSPASLVVNFGDGNDYVRILPGTRLNNVSINVSAVNRGVSDVDTVELNGVKTNGSVTIKTGAGVDNVFVQNSTIGDGIGADALIINTGAGGDYVQVGNLTSLVNVRGDLSINTFATAIDADADWVNVMDVAADRNISIGTGAGDDRVDMLGTSALGVAISTDDGNDTVTVRDVYTLNHFYALLGNGNDSMNLQGVEANGGIYVDGGEGWDSLVQHLNTTPSLSAVYFENVNGVDTSIHHLGIGSGIVNSIQVE